MGPCHWRLRGRHFAREAGEESAENSPKETVKATMKSVILSGTPRGDSGSFEKGLYLFIG